MTVKVHHTLATKLSWVAKIPKTTMPSQPHRVAIETTLKQSVGGGFQAMSKPSSNDKLLLPAIASLTHAGSQNQNTTPETKCKVLAG